MLKYLLCLLFCFGLSGTAFCQGTRTGIPPFKIRLVDGTGFTYQQIEKNRPLLLIYFSPTCDHCKEFVAALLQNKNRWKDKQVVLISYEHIREVKAFADSYHLSAYPNIKIGSEGYTFVVQQYYQIQRFPFVALFSRQGKLIKIISDKLAPEAMVHQI